MKFSYKFHNILGAVYKSGNLQFSNDGNTVISPVGNRLAFFDLKNNKTQTLPVATASNITAAAISPDGRLAILAGEDNDAILVSLTNQSVLHTHTFHGPIRSIRFSPDCNKFVVLTERAALVYHTPGIYLAVNPFVLHRVYKIFLDATTCADWSSDSRILAVGSKDMSCRILASDYLKQLHIYSLGAHKSEIVGCFFEENSLDVYTISRDATINIWECDTDLEAISQSQKRKVTEVEGELEGEVEDVLDKETKELDKKSKKDKEGMISYTRKMKHFFNKPGDFDDLTCCDFNKSIKLLVIGFASGTFQMFELPELSSIHSLNVSDRRIETIAFNGTGDWVALASAGLGQLVVWEWQSETMVLSQQGHYDAVGCLSYSPSGGNLVTGSHDGKVKVWDATSGFCFVTFSEHTSGVTGVVYTARGDVILSASLDGSVRAYDMHRYRNFRTFTSPRPAQFGCLATDPSGEVVVAGCTDTFEVYVWSVATGGLLEVLAGHQGPVCSAAFSPIRSVLVTISWDRTLRIWDVFESRGSREVLSLQSDGLVVCFRPDGREVAVATLDAQITFWDVESATQTGSIEGRRDLGAGRGVRDTVTAATSSLGKSFTSLCYSADGTCLLAAGKSKMVCIYNVAQGLLVKRLEISCNRSLDGSEEFLDRRKMTEFGNPSLVDPQDDEPIRLPGVKRSDMSGRSFAPQVAVSAIRFSPSADSWAAATTEGVLIYSLDPGTTFDPYDLDLTITPSSALASLQSQQWTDSLMQSIKLNESRLIIQVLESIPLSHIESVVLNLPINYVIQLIPTLTACIERTPHVEFYLKWAFSLLESRALELKKRSQAIMPTVIGLEKALVSKLNDLGKLCDSNRYTMDYLLATSNTMRRKQIGVLEG